MAAGVPRSLYVCSQWNGDESTHTESMGREAFAGAGPGSLAALAVRSGQLLLPAGHVAGAVLGCAGQSGAVPAAVALVAAVRLAVAVRYRLAPPLVLARALRHFVPSHVTGTAPQITLNATGNAAFMKQC